MTQAQGTNSTAGVAMYRKLGVQSEVETASPHRLIQMLLDGAMGKIAIARGNLNNGDIAGKGANISWAISIIGGLRTSLDLKGGGEIAENLDRLYDYMNQQLVMANLHNDADKLNEVYELLGELRAGWDGIKPLANGAPADIPASA